jgi:hypothetical protein
MHPLTFAEQLEIFHGRLNPASAHVYAQLPGVTTQDGLSLTGFLRGPHCLHSTTLPATIKFTDAGPGDSLLAKATLPDPCFWSPAIPSLYDAHLELRRGEEVLAVCERKFGIRALDVRGKFLYEQGKRFVLRGVAAQLDPLLRSPANSLPDLLPWHDAPAAMLAKNPANALCEEAARVGVLVVAGVTSDQHALQHVQRLSRFACVAMIALAGEVRIDNDLRLAAKNTILARWNGAAEDLAVNDGCEAIVVSLAGDPNSVAATGHPCWASQTIPVIVWRSLDYSSSQQLQAARAACDELQAALAPLGDFAGYFV